MTIPIYNKTVLPCITYPMKNTHTQTRKYLGGKAVTGDVSIGINIVPETDLEQLALYNFWLNDCNYGLEPFLIALPVFGKAISITHPTLLVKFKGDFSSDKDEITWSQSISLELLGTIDYVIDDLGDFIVSDAGEYIVTDNGDYMPTGNIINSHREVFYAN